MPAAKLVLDEKLAELADCAVQRAPRHMYCWSVREARSHGETVFAFRNPVEVLSSELVR